MRSEDGIKWFQIVVKLSQMISYYRKNMQGLTNLLHKQESNVTVKFFIPVPIHHFLDAWFLLMPFVWLVWSGVYWGRGDLTSWSGSVAQQFLQQLLGQLKQFTLVVIFVGIPCCWSAFAWAPSRFAGLAGLGLSFFFPRQQQNFFLKKPILDYLLNLATQNDRKRVNR